MGTAGCARMGQRSHTPGGFWGLGTRRPRPASPAPLLSPGSARLNLTTWNRFPLCHPSWPPCSHACWKHRGLLPYPSPYSQTSPHPQSASCMRACWTHLHCLQLFPLNGCQDVVQLWNLRFAGLHRKERPVQLWLKGLVDVVSCKGAHRLFVPVTAQAIERCTLTDHNASRARAY